MKRLFFITCSFLVFFAGTAAAWESCRQIRLVPDNTHHSASAHGHDHHSEPEGHDSDAGMIHCPPLDSYLPTANFTVTKDHRVERVVTPLAAAFDHRLTNSAGYRLIHGPPGFARKRNIPSYLLLSVLRI
jgi:hypothetical protein